MDDDPGSERRQGASPGIDRSSYRMNSADIVKMFITVLTTFVIVIGAVYTWKTQSEARDVTQTVAIQALEQSKASREVMNGDSKLVMQKLDDMDRRFSERLDRIEKQQEKQKR